MRRKVLLSILIVAALAFSIGYIQATPLGGARVTLLDGNGKALTDYGRVYYTVWTFDEDGSIKTLQRNTLERNFIFSSNTIRISAPSLNQAREIAKRIGSKTAFIGIDLWIVKEGEVYTLPPESFETKVGETTLPESVKLRINLMNATVKRIKKKTTTTTKTGGKNIKPLISGHWYEWRTVRENSYNNVKIPVLIIHNWAWTDVFGTVDIAAEIQKYWGPEVTVAFGDQISEKVNFDPSSITVKVLGRSITDYYAGGDDITVPKEYSGGYVWIKGTVHYIHQKEYSCYTGLGCFETGNERYFAKIDRFSISETINGIKNIESGHTLGMPPYNFPTRWMKKSDGIPRSIGQKVYLENFYGKIYAGSDGHSFGVGVPVGAILKGLSGGALPDWFDAITIGFSTGDYASYVMLGHLKNKGPASQVTFYAMESEYKVRIPVHHWYGTTYEDVNVPIGLYVEVD